MKKVILTCLCAVFLCSAFAQSYKETFDSNSLEWTERAYKNNQGTAIIADGTMTVKSYSKVNLLALAAGKVDVTTTSYETHCYTPLDVEKPFEITSNVTVKNGMEYGVVFNYRDDGNFYVFSTDGKDYVKFSRYEDNRYVGGVTQGVKWKKKLLGKTQQIWTIRSNGNTLEFIVNEEPIMKMRYMPLQYNGFGYYTVGACELVIDEVTFSQLY
jgi:hypothetical protein